MKLSKRTETVPGSPTLALAAKAIELKNKGVDVISLSVGEPDWDTFDACKNAGLKAIQKGATRYTSASGIIELKNALSEKFSKRFGLDLKNKNVLVTPGAKYAIQQALWAMVNPGEKVGVFVPFWASYSTMITISGGVPESIPLSKKFYLEESELVKALEKGVKVLLINSPNNPSGGVLRKEDYRVLAKVLKLFPDVRLILDDIYSELYWGEGECPHFLDENKSYFDRVVLISGASKVYSMTGWRIGWAIGSPNLISAMSKYQSQTTGCPSSIGQEAALSGVLDTQGCVQASIEKLKGRCLKGLKIINSIEGMSVEMPKGAFYFWIDISVLLDKFKITDKEFCEQLLQEEFVVLVPGTDFGQPGFIRASFAVSSEKFESGFTRISSFVDSLN